VNKKLTIVLASLMSLLLIGGSAGASDAGDANNFLFAAGGTPVTNGFFFPGTRTCDSNGCTEVGPPLQIDRGDDVTFVNLDAGVVTNSHQIFSIKRRKKNRRPLFSSAEVSGPGQTVMKMSHVKPGKYLYLCSFHFGMYGEIEVLDN
jgi:hypothetical protein